MAKWEDESIRNIFGSGYERRYYRFWQRKRDWREKFWLFFEFIQLFGGYNFSAIFKCLAKNILFDNQNQSSVPQKLSSLLSSHYQTHCHTNLIITSVCLPWTAVRRKLRAYKRRSTWISVNFSVIHFPRIRGLWKLTRTHKSSSAASKLLCFDGWSRLRSRTYMSSWASPQTPRSSIYQRPFLCFCVIYTFMHLIQRYMIWKYEGEI